MKKAKYLILSMLTLVTMLAGCSSVNKPYIYSYNDINYTVNPEEQTITCGEHIYTYTFSGNTSQCDIEITYPDNSRYYITKDENVSYGGSSDDYNPDKYVDGSILCDAILENAPKEKGRSNLFLIILLFAFGILGTVSPKTIWQLEYGWRFKNAEPSDIALTVNRVVGVVLMIIAAVFIFI